MAAKRKILKFISLLMLIVLSMSALSYATTSTSVNGKTYTHPKEKQESNIVVVKGVDVSYWQGNNIDWKKAKADGIEYAILRAGFSGKSNGSFNKDSTFETNVKNASAAGVNIGVYYWSEATSTTEAKKEAEYVNSIISKYKDKINMPVAMDFEFASDARSTKKWNSLKSSSGVSKARSTFTNIAKAWMDAIKTYGYTPCFYSYYALTEPTVGTHKVNMSSLEAYKFWYAQYNTKVNYTGNIKPLEFWQHTSSGSVSGMSGKIDRNFWYYDKNGDGTAKDTTSIRKTDISLKYKEMKAQSTAVRNPVTVKMGSTTLKEGTDYQLIYINNLVKGTARVIVKGIGAYSNNISLTYKVGAKDTLSLEPLVKPEKVTGIKAVPGEYGFNLSFPAVKNAVKYSIEYGFLGDTKWYAHESKTPSWVDACEWADDEADEFRHEGGVVLEIRAKAINERDKERIDGEYSDILTVYPAKAYPDCQLKKYPVGNDSVEDAIEVYFINDVDDGLYSPEYCKIYSEVDGKTQSKKIRISDYSPFVIKPGKDKICKIYVKPMTTIDDKNYYGFTTYKYINTYDVPSISTTVSCANKRIRVKCANVSGLQEEYRIKYREAGGSWKTKTSTSTTTNLSLSENKCYDVKAVRYIVSGGKKYTNVYGSTSYRLLQTTAISKLTPKIDSVTVKYDAKSCSGYKITYADNKDFKSSKTVTVKGKSSVQTVITGLKSKTTYYFKVKPYKTVNGIDYTGQLSAVKSVKTK